MTSLTQTVQSANGAVDDEKLKRFGWAPGRYMITCMRCRQTTQGNDKRALICKPCAIAALNSAGENDHG